jgi:hypothetical protein
MKITSTERGINGVCHSKKVTTGVLIIKRGIIPINNLEGVVGNPPNHQSKDG